MELVKIIVKRETEGFMKNKIEDNGMGMTSEKQQEILKGK